MTASGYSVERAFGVSFACWVLLLVFSQIYLLKSRISKYGAKEIYTGKIRIHSLCALSLICILVGLVDPGTVFFLIPRALHLTLQVFAVCFLLAALLVVMFTYVQAYYCLLEVQGGSAISKYHLIVGWTFCTFFYWGGEFLAYTQAQRRLAALSKCLILILLILLLIMELYDYCEIRNLIRELVNLKSAHRRSSVTVTSPLDRTLSGSSGIPKESPQTEIREVQEQQTQIIENRLRCPIAVSKKVHRFQLKCLIFTMASLVLVIVLLAFDIVHAKEPPTEQNPITYEPSYAFFLCLFSCLCFLYRTWTPLLEPVIRKARKIAPGKPTQDPEGERAQLRDFFSIEMSMKNQIQAICKNDNSIDNVAFYVDPDPLDCFVKRISQNSVKQTQPMDSKPSSTTTTSRTLQSDLDGFFNDKREKKRGGFERGRTTLSSLSEDEFLHLSQLKSSECFSLPSDGLTIVTDDPTTQPTVFIITDECET